MNKDTENYFKNLCFQLQSDFNDIPEFVMDEWEKLKEEFEEYKKESIRWSTIDFMDLEKDGWEITEEQAGLALEDMISHHDCNNGITWVDVDYWYEQYGTEVEEGKESWRKALEDK